MMRRLAIVLVALAIVVPFTTTQAGPAADQIALLEARIAALESRVTALETAPAATPRPAPSPTPLPTATATPTPTASPTPTPTPLATPSAPLPTSATCGSTLQAVLDAAPAGAAIDLGSCVYLSGATAGKPVTLTHGTIRQAGTALRIAAADVTVDGVRFDGGSNTVLIDKAARARILNSTFVNMRESSIRLVGPGADDVLIASNTITQSILTAHGYSPIAGQAPGALNRNLHIVGNTIDQGAKGIAWFGIEVWDNAGLVIESNNLKGAGTQLSIPRSDGAIIRGNSLDLTGTGWGMEISDVDSAQVIGNTGFGSSSGGSTWTAMVQLHPGSGSVNGTVITGNRLTNYAALVNAPPAPGSGSVVIDNCLVNVARLNWGTFPTPVTIARNGPLEGPCKP